LQVKLVVLAKKSNFGLTHFFLIWRWHRCFCLRLHYWFKNGSLD